MSLKLVRKKKDIIFKNGNYESYRKKVEKLYQKQKETGTIRRANWNVSELEKAMLDLK